MTTRAVRTALHVTREREYQAGMKGAERALQGLAGGVHGAGRLMAGMGPQAAVAVAGLAAVTAAATATVVAVRAVTQAVIALGQRGGEISPVADTFERLASPDLLGRLQQLAGYQIDNMTLMTRSNQVLETRIVSEQQWAQAVEATVRAAQNLNRPIEQSVEAMATFASGGGMEGLARLGVNVLAIRDRLRDLGITAESTQGRMISMDLALEQLNGSLGEIDNSSSNVGDSWNQLNAAIRNAYDAIALGFAENQRLVQTFDALAAATRGSATDGEDWGTAIADAVVEVTQALVAALPPTIAMTRAIVQMTEFVLGLHEAFAALVTFGMSPLIRHVLGIPSPANEARRALGQLDDALGAVGDVAQDASDRFADLVARVRGGAPDIDRAAATLAEAAGIARTQVAPGMDAARDSMGQAQRSAAIMTDTIRSLGSAMATTGEQSALAAAEMEQALSRAAALTEAIQQETQAAIANAKGATRPSGGGGPSRAQLLEEAAMQGGQERKAFEVEQAAELERWISEEYERQRDALRDVITALDERQAATDAEAERWREYWDERKGLEEEAAEAEREQAEEKIRLEQEVQAAQMARIKSAIDSTRQLAGAMKSSFGAIIGAMEATGVSTEKTKRAYGVLLVAYNSVMAATDLADMATAIGKQDYVAAAAYGLAMAGHIAAAIQAGAELGGGSAKTPQTAVFTPAERAEPEDRPTEGRGTVINNNYGFGQGNSAIGEAVTQHVRHYQRMEGVRHEAPAFYG